MKLIPLRVGFRINIMMSEKIKITECPRDAIQGLQNYIPTRLKVEYLNKLLQVGFDTLDFGSFVSPQAVPQMKDTAQVVEKLDLASSSTKLLAIIPYRCGYDKVDACKFEEITYVGYPLSVSETFQLKNVHTSYKDSFEKVKEIQEGLVEHPGKRLQIYISMAFGNPYGDEWNIDIINNTVKKLKELDITNIALSDTIGLGKPENIEEIFRIMINEYPEIEFGAHFHSKRSEWKEKVDAAFLGGCRKFDGALSGYGGCPLSGYDMIGNVATENLLAYFEERNIDLGLNKENLSEALEFAPHVFKHNQTYIPPAPYYDF